MKPIRVSAATAVILANVKGIVGRPGNQDVGAGARDGNWGAGPGRTVTVKLHELVPTKFVAVGRLGTSTVTSYPRCWRAAKHRPR